MLKHRKLLVLLMAVLAGSLSNSGELKKEQKKDGPRVEVTGSAPVVLWHNPVDISTRDLFYGAGGKDHEPRGGFTFVEEDLEGSNPKFVVRDEDGVKWKVKLGNEARPETAAARLVWAAGFVTNEDYFVPELHVSEMPTHLHRGQSLVGPGGTVHNVRLKRHLKDEEKTGIWSWRDNPFHSTRELNGLRVMMALINNWDLKDVNNAVYQQKKPSSKGKAGAKEKADGAEAQDGEGAKDGDGPKDGADSKKSASEKDRAGAKDASAEGGSERIYVVSDLGGSFGSNGIRRTHAQSKDNLEAYTRSKFITHVNGDYVDFATPGRPALIVLFSPQDYFRRLGLRWIGRQIPIADARWMGQVLAQLSPKQIRDAFRAAGYSPQEVEGFATVIQDRIARLNRL